MLQTAPAVSPAITVKQSNQSKALFLHLAPPTAEEWEGLKILIDSDKDRLHVRVKTLLDEVCKALQCNTD